jgi:hypothetical protein
MYLEVPSLFASKTPTETALSKSSNAWAKGKEVTLSPSKHDFYLLLKLARDNESFTISSF